MKESFPVRMVGNTMSWSKGSGPLVRWSKREGPGAKWAKTKWKL